MNVQLKLPIARYLEVRSAAGATYAYDDSSIFFLSTMTGMPQVWRQSSDVPWPQQVTFFQDRVMSVAASPTAPVLCVSADVGGGERAQLYLMDFDGQGIENITNAPDYIHRFGGFSPDGRWIAYSTNRRNKRDFDIYLFDMESHEHKLVYESDHTNGAIAFHPTGQSLIVNRQHTNLNNDLFLLNLTSSDMTLLTAHDGEALYASPRFTQDGKELYLLSNLDSEFVRLAKLDLATKSIAFLTKDDWDTEWLTMSHDKDILLVTRNEDGTSKVYTYRVGEESGTCVSVSQVPGGVVMHQSAAKAHRNRFALTISSPLTATEIFELNLDDGDVQRVTYASISSVPNASYVAPELVHYPSFDGLSIPAYYYRPKDTVGPYNVIVYVHGGPEGQSQNSFSSIIQYFVNQGYAVFVPNVRGSAGYGRAYLHLDDVRLRMDSVADLAKCVDWLVDVGDANKDGIVVMGGSYGGFMVLAAMTHYPTLWAAGIDIVGIANLRTFIENTSAYRRHLRECEYGTVEDDGEFFDEISPIHHVDKIDAPLMVIHGANDPRVPIGEAEQIVTALESRNHQVTYLRFEDEGHGIVKLPNRIRAYGAIAAFLEEHLPSIPCTS